MTGTSGSPNLSALGRAAIAWKKWAIIWDAETGKTRGETYASAQAEAARLMELLEQTVANDQKRLGHNPLETTK